MTSYNPFSLEGKTILITGASSGIGRAISIECSKMGAIVSVVGRDQVRLEETLSCLEGTQHKLFLADLTSENNIETLVAGLIPLDGVVHSAGIIKRFPLKYINEEVFESLLKINLIAPALFTPLPSN